MPAVERSPHVYIIAILLVLVLVSFITSDHPSSEVSVIEKIQDLRKVSNAHSLHLHHADYKKEILKALDDPSGYNNSFWTPIEIDTDRKDPLITFCRLNFQTYGKQPHVTPMFKDLLAMSQCSGKGKLIQKTLSSVKDVKYSSLYESSEIVPQNIDPTGFVFHESRVGSTLVGMQLHLNIPPSSHDNFDSVQQICLPAPAIRLFSPSQHLQHRSFCIVPSVLTTSKFSCSAQ